jgi:hypothetical protein
MTCRRFTVASLLLGLLVPAIALATVCAKKSGALYIRGECKRSEVALTDNDVGSTSNLASALATLACPPDAVRVGPVCVDKYEASVWNVPSPGIVAKVRAGEATLSDLLAAGAVQVGVPTSDHGICNPGLPAEFTPSGALPPTVRLYAASIPAVKPTACVTWFQAEVACRLAGKRLATNQEWQAAATGTPDAGIDDGATTCRTTSGTGLTGSRTKCKSLWGAYDMVGNVWEWVADWVPISGLCHSGWGYPIGSFSDDAMCAFQALPGGDADGPAALNRGGGGLIGVGAGPLAVQATYTFDLSSLPDFVGFRCAR